MQKLELYDTTLRDGAQMEGMSLSVEDKLKIARKLDELGVHYIDGWWGAIKDAGFLCRRIAELAACAAGAFGSTRKRAVMPPPMRTCALLDARTPVVTLARRRGLHVR
jgi:2-isopropylmalate synthase